MSENLTHSEETMQKVWGALLKAGLSEQKVIDVVSDMQNAGILFRERGEAEWMERGGYRAKARAALVAAQGAVPDAATEASGSSKTLADEYLELFHDMQTKYVKDTDALFLARKKAEAERDAALAAIERIRQAVSGHPECDRYEEGDVISCGWKSAYASVVAALDEAPEPEWEWGVEVEGEVAVRERAIAERACDSADYATLVHRRKAGPWLPVEKERL